MCETYQEFQKILSDNFISKEEIFKLHTLFLLEFKQTRMIMCFQLLNPREGYREMNLMD